MTTKIFTVRKKLFFALLITSLSLVFSLLIAEMGLRFIYSEVEADGTYFGRDALSHHDLTGYVYAPGYEGYAVRAGIFKTPVRINSLNLRQEDMDQQLQYPVKLLILGDSFSFGLGVQEEQSFPSLIKTDLNTLNVGVINGSQSGYSVEQERLFGTQLMEQLNPDITLLSLFAANDIEGDYSKRYLDYDIKHGYILSNTRWLQTDSFDYLRTHSYLWMYARNKWVILKDKLNWRLRDKKSRKFEAALRHSIQEVIQPTLDSIIKLRDYCERNNIGFAILMIPPRSGETLFDTHLKSFFQKENITVLDLGLTGYSDNEYLQGDAHWNEKGHKKAAQSLVPFIKKFLE